MGISGCWHPPGNQRWWICSRCVCQHQPGRLQFGNRENLTSFLSHLKPDLPNSEPRLWRGCSGLVQREESDPCCGLQQQHCEDLGCQAIVVDNCSSTVLPNLRANNHRSLLCWISLGFYKLHIINQLPCADLWKILLLWKLQPTADNIE